MISNLHQIELDLGLLSVHGVIARIEGPTVVQPNTNFVWSAVVSGGKAPFAFAWYRDGGLVSTSSTYAGNSESSDFQLRLDVSDALSDASSDTVFVQIVTCPPPQISC